MSQLSKMFEFVKLKKPLTDSFFLGLNNCVVGKTVEWDLFYSRGIVGEHKQVGTWFMLRGMWLAQSW
jgi:hypothetical protein